MKRHILALFLAIVMMAGSLTVAFAKSPVRLNDAQNFNEFRKQTEDMVDSSKLFKLKDGKNVKQNVDLSDTFQTGRIIVHPDRPLPQNVLQKAQKAVSYLDYVVLQFGSKEAAKEAYGTLKAQYGKTRVFPDVIFRGNMQSVKGIVPVESREYPLDGPYLSWGVTNMGLDKVTEKLSCRSDKPMVKVAVLDTGLNYIDTVSECGRIANAFDAVLFNPLPMDFNGHGTFCAGVISESTPDNVLIAPIKVMTMLGFGSTLSLMVGLMYANTIKADVVSMSLGGEDILGVPYLDDFFKDLRNNKACIVVASGNEQQDTKNCYPANSEYVICVGGLKKNNKVDKTYSNFGANVDFVAPGTDVGGHYELLGLPVIMNLTGTSMAAPHVAAACALVKCVHKDYDQDQVYDVLKSCAVDIGAKGKDAYSGWGRIDMSSFAAKL